MERARTPNVDLSSFAIETNYSSDDESEETSEGTKRKKAKHKKHDRKRSSSKAKNADQDSVETNGQSNITTGESSRSAANRGRSRKRKLGKTSLAKTEGSEQVICGMCNKHYKNNLSLKQHVREYHKNQTLELSADESGTGSDSEVVCAICQKGYKTLKSYRHHFRMKHVGKHDECVVRRSTKESIPTKEESNIIKWPGNTQWAVGKTEQESPTYSQLKVNVSAAKRESSVGSSRERKTKGGNSSAVDDESMHRCPFCDVSYQRACHLSRHISFNHGKGWMSDHRDQNDTTTEEESENVSGKDSLIDKEGKDLRRVPCTFCSKMYKTRKTMRHHRRKEHRDEMLHGMIGKQGRKETNQLKSSEGLQNSVMSFESEEEMSTDSKNSRSYKSKNSNNVQGSNDLRNEVTFSKFVDNEDDIGHSTNEDSECSVFEGDSEVEYSEDRIPCPLCSKTYKTKKSMRAHCRKKHRNEIVSEKDLSETEENVIKSEKNSSANGAPCPLCSKSFENKKIMTLHFKKDHFSGRSFPPDLVSKESENSSKIELESRKERIFCPLCPKSYKHKKSLRAHCIQDHVGKDVVVGTYKTTELEEATEHGKCGTQEKLISMPVIVDCSTSMYIICGCGLVFRTERNRHLHMLTLGKYHINHSYQIVGTQQMIEMATLRCGFCWSRFRSNDALRRHLNDFHFDRREAGNEVDRSPSVDSSNFLRANKSPKNTTTNFPEKSPSSLHENDPNRDPFEQATNSKMNRCISDECIVKEVLTNASNKSGPIRLLDAESPKKFNQKFQNFVITFTEEKNDYVRIVSKNSESKAGKYSAAESKSLDLNVAEMNKRQKIGDLEMVKDRSIGKPSRSSSVVLDRNKVKAVNVGVDEDTSSEGDKSPDLVTGSDPLTVNVKQYLSRSPTRLSPFVKLTNICEGQQKFDPKKPWNKYASTKPVTKTMSAGNQLLGVVGRRKSLESKKIKFRDENGAEITYSQAQQTSTNGNEVEKYLQNCDESASVCSDQEIEDSYEASDVEVVEVEDQGDSSPTEENDDTEDMSAADEWDNAGCRQTSATTNGLISEKKSVDDRDRKRISAADKKQKKRLLPKSKKSSPGKKSTYGKRALFTGKLEAENTQRNFPENDAASSSRSVSEIASAQGLRSGKTKLRVPAQGGISRKRNTRISQPYLKRNTAAFKIQAVKKKLLKKAKISSPEAKRVSPRLNKNQTAQGEDLVAADPNLRERISLETAEFGENRIQRIEKLKHQAEFLLHQIKEMHDTPQVAQADEVNITTVGVEPFSTSAKRKVSKLKISKSKSVRRGKRIVTSSKEVPITPEKNIEDSIHFPQASGLVDQKESKEALKSKCDFGSVQISPAELMLEEDSENESVRKHRSAEALETNTSSRRTRSWSPTKQRKTPPSDGKESSVLSPSAAGGKQQIEQSLSSSKTPVVKLNKLEEQWNGQYLKFLNSVDRSSKSSEQGIERSEKSRSRNVRKRSYSVDSSLDVGEGNEMTTTFGNSVGGELLMKSLDLQLNRNEAEIENSAISMKKDSQRYIERPLQRTITNKGDAEEYVNHQTDECNLEDGSNEEIAHNADLNYSNENFMESTSREQELQIQSEVDNMKVNRAVVDGVINNQSQVLFVHKDEIIYAEEDSVVQVDKEEVKSLRDQVSKKRSKKGFPRKRKATEESPFVDETDGNVQAEASVKKDVFSPSIRSVLNDIEPKHAPLKPVKALEIRVVSDDEIVSSTIVEGSFAKQDLASRIVALMEFAENPEVVAPVKQVTEPSFVIKKDVPPKFSCHKCDVTFNMKSNLKRHRSTCHPEDEFRSFDIGRKSNISEIVELEEQDNLQDQEILCDQEATEDISLSDYEEEIKEGLKQMYGGVLDAELKVKKLKLQDTMNIDGLILHRKHKNTWKIMNEKCYTDSLLPYVNNDESSYCKNMEPAKKIEVKDNKSKKYVEPEEQNSYVDIHSSVDQRNIAATSLVTASTSTATSSVASATSSAIASTSSVVDATSSVADIEGGTECQNSSLLKESVPKRPHKKKTHSSKSTKGSNMETESKKKSNPAPLTDFERAILEPKKKHKRPKRKTSVVESGKEIGPNDCEDKGKPILANEKDLKDKTGKVRSDKETVLPKSKIVQKILREKAKEEEIENMKFVPITDEPLPSFEEILQQKSKPMDNRNTEKKNDNGEDVAQVEARTDKDEVGDESPETGVESPNDFSSTSSSGSSGNKISTLKSVQVCKVAKDKQEREEVLAAITGKPKTKPFKIPKTASSEMETLVEWKSPLQDIGQIEKFRFGAKQDVGPSKLSMPSVVSSVSVDYDAILSDVEKPEGLIKHALSVPLEVSKLEEPSTSSGNKQVGDRGVPPVKKPRIELISWKDEDIMTPDSTTPDRYLEMENTETEIAPVKDTSSAETNLPGPSTVSSNVSSTGKLGEWNEENESCHREGDDTRKPGIPKSTSTPLKHIIPSSSKKPLIIDTSSSVKALCSQTTVEKVDCKSTSSKVEIYDERVTTEKRKEVKCEDDKMDVDLDEKLNGEENLKEKDEDVGDLESCEEGDKKIENKEEDSEESEEEEEESEEEEKSEKSSEKTDDSESEKETKDSDEDSESEDEKEQKTSKPVMEMDLDVLDVCASDEESWLNEEEDGKSQKDFSEEDEAVEGSGIRNNGEDRKEQVMEEVEMEIDDASDGEGRIEVTQTSRNQVNEIENVIVTESTMEYDDVDFQSNSIMKSLIPNGFCFQYISYNKCNKPMCKYRHDVPSKEEIFKKGIHEISRLYNQSDKTTAFDIYYKLLELNFHDSIPTKCIMKLLSLTEEDCDVTLAFSLISHTEKIRSIEFHSTLIAMSSLTPGYYVENLWKLFTCLQKLDKCLTSQNVVVLLRAFEEKQQWQRLWSTMVFGLRCTGFLPPVYITRSALEAFVEDTEGCFREAVQWIESCDQEQLYNQEDKLLDAVADICLKQGHPKAAEILRSIANKVQPSLTESTSGDRDSDTSSVHSEDRNTCQEDTNSDNHKFFINRVMGVKFSKNWEYLAQIFLELSNIERAQDPRYIRAFVEVFTFENKRPNVLVEAFKEFMEKVNSIFLKEKSEDDTSWMDRSSLGIIGAELVNFCAMSQWWREGLSVVKTLHNSSIQYLTRKSPGGALMSTIALDVCLRCKKPYQALQLLSECRWSCVNGLKMDKPDFKERVVQLNTLVKQFINMKRPSMAFTVLHRVLMKAQIDQQFDLYNSLIGFEENFHVIITQLLGIGDPKTAHDAYEVCRNACVAVTSDLGLLQRIVVACGEARYLTGVRNVFNHLQELNVYPPQEIPQEPRPLCINLLVQMSLTECMTLIEDFLQWLYKSLCDWCVENRTCFIPESYLTLSMRMPSTGGPDTQMRGVERKLKALRHLLENNLSPGLSVFITSLRMERRIQVTIPSLFKYLLALDVREGGKRQGFKRWTDENRKKGIRVRQDVPWSSRC